MKSSSVNKHASADETSRAVSKLRIELEVLNTQEHLWKLRARLKRIRIADVERQLRSRKALT